MKPISSQFKPTTLLKTLVLMMLLAFSGLNLSAQGDATSFAPSGNGSPFFEGMIDYRIVITGRQANELLMNEPAQKMRMILKDDGFIIHLFEGRYPKSFLFVADSNQTYILDQANKRAFRRDRYLDTTTVVPVAKPTGKTAEVKGRTCQEYVMKKPQMNTYFYVSDEYRMDTTLYADLDDAKANFLTHGLGGRIPLRTVIKQPGLTITTELLNLKPMEVDPVNFQFPEGWKVKNRDNRFGG